MLFSTEKCVTGRRPAFMAWFGNFFEPYFSSEEAVVEGLEDLRRLGFNSIVLDSKLWSDFTRYFRTGGESPYVRMQNFITRQAAERGLGVSFLALFAIGDNLYPEIYDHPPEFVEQPVDFWGQPFRGYRHWAGAQTDEHIRHCLDLYRHIAKDAAARAVDEAGNERLPFYFYHSPIFAPSFDADGRSTYLNWLKGLYSLEELNARYETAFASFDDLSPEDYWTNPAHASEQARHIPAAGDYAARTPTVRKYADNQCFKREVMRAYFADIVSRLRREEPRFYFYAALSQWKLFFSDYVHIQNRGWDLWDLGSILDSPSFITMPIDNHGQVEPYVVPCEMAMLRSAAGDRDFVGSLFLGRYMANDIYAVCSPAEIIASAFGAGATDLYFYGYNGLDDGGNFGKWGKPEKDSLRRALDWFSTVRDVAGRRTKTRRAAIVFPHASYALSAHPTDTRIYNAFRDDLLGWYRQLADLGINADILHPSQIRQGELAGYGCVVVPSDPHYWAMPDKEVEEALRAYVESGGLLLHSMAEPVHRAFELKAAPHPADSFGWEEKVVTDSAEFASYASGEPQAIYLSDQQAAYVLHHVGRGAIHSFGFLYGSAYGCREHLPVPREYKKENHYPLTMLKRTPVDRLLTEAGLSARRARGVESIAFENGELVVNHTPYTVEMRQTQDALSTFEGFNGTHLPGRHAVFLPAS
jgi:hypothetical protein